VTEWILETIAAGGYWGIAFLMAVENIFPPIPSELIMGLGGINLAHGRMTFWPLLIAGTIGSTVGNYFWYQVGRQLGYERLRPTVDRFGRWLTLDWPEVERLVGFFNRHGHWIVFTMRFSPVLRTMISLPAGLARMRRVEFIAYTFAGSGIWNLLLIWAGYTLGTNFSALEKYTGPVAVGSMLLIIVYYFWRVATWRPRG